MQINGARKHQRCRRTLCCLQGRHFLLGVDIIDDIKASIFVCGDGQLVGLISSLVSVESKTTTARTMVKLT